MTFKKNIPINVTGASYQSRSKPLSSQQTKMFYPQLVEEGKDQFVLHPFYGLKTLSTGTGADRGARFALGKAYQVEGQKLYSFDSNGIKTEIGAIAGNDRCILTDDGTNLIIVSNNTVYNYDGSTITTVTDSNIAGSQAAGFINNQIIYTKPNLFIVADVGDPTTASGLNAANAESQPDDLVRAYPYQQTVYMFGDKSTEPYWNTGEGNPPMSRIDGQIFEVGLGAIHSPAHTDEFLYWIGDDFSIYRATGGNREKVSNPALSSAIAKYARIDDAIGNTFTIEGQNFYSLSFPTADKTWCCSEFLGNKGWFELSSGDSDGIYQGSTFLKAYGKNFVIDKDTSNIYELDLLTFTNNSDPIHRRRVTSSINGKLFGQAGARVQMSRFELIMEAGNGLISGQGENPRIQFEISYDGGRSWLPKGWGRVGRLGEYVVKVEMFNLDTFYDAIIRITSTDPIQHSIYSAGVDLRLAGK
jgi:hypothetical protein